MSPILKRKVRGCMVGMASGDAVCCGQVSQATHQALCVLKAMKDDSKDLEGFMDSLTKYLTEWCAGESEGKDEATTYVCNELIPEGSLGAQPWTKSGLKGYWSSAPMARGIPIGMLLAGDPARLIDFSRNACAITHADTTPQCATVAVALLVSHAMSGVAAGLWANELSNFVSGIDEEIMAGIKHAAWRATQRVEVEEALRGFGDPESPGAALASVVYCCMKSPNDFDGAMLIVKQLPDSSGRATVGAIVGACMGIRVGEQGVKAGDDILLMDMVGNVDEFLTPTQ